MCRHYFFEGDIELIEAIEAMNRDAINRGSVFVPPEVCRGEIAPGSIAPVIANNRAGLPGLFNLRMGFSRYDGQGLLVNARSETAAIKPTFREGMAMRRCLVPATRYFEHQRLENGGKIQRTRYAIAPDDGKLMYFAGIYRYEQLARLPAFVILTRPPAPIIAFIHDRMPLIVPHELREEWLKPTGDTQSVIENASENVYFTKI